MGGATASMKFICISNCAERNNYNNLAKATQKMSYVVPLVLCGVPVLNGTEDSLYTYQ